MSEVTISIAEIPAGFCPQGPASDWPYLVSLLSASIAGSVLINFGSTTPAAADQSKPWFRTNADGTPDGLYTYSGGYWLKRHQLAATSVQLWEGDITQVHLFDGGEAGAVTTISGPFWEEVTDMRAKIPMHPGTTANGIAIAANANAGEDKHAITIAELPAHTHQFASGDFVKSFAATLTGKENDINLTGALDYKPAQTLQNTGGDIPMSLIPPVRGIYFIRRTARLYYRI